jgi:hypothetical protein
VYVIAIHYEPGAGEPLVEPLARALDRSLYEIRARLSSPEGGPAVVANYGEIEPAWACAGRLRAEGIAPILILPEEVEKDADRFQVRDFELGESAIRVTSRRGETVEIPFAEIGLVLRGTWVEEKIDTQVTEKRKLSLSRAIVTGGMLITKVHRNVKQVRSEERDDFLQLYAPGRPPLAFRSAALRYQGLGAELQPSIHANFNRLIEALRRALPHARWDERLASRPGHARVLGPGLTDSHLDLAISLLARVLLPV